MLRLRRWQLKPYIAKDIPEGKFRVLLSAVFIRQFYLQSFGIFIDFLNPRSFHWFCLLSRAIFVNTSGIEARKSTTPQSLKFPPPGLHPFHNAAHGCYKSITAKTSAYSFSVVSTVSPPPNKQNQGAVVGVHSIVTCHAGLAQGDILQPSSQYTTKGNSTTSRQKPSRHPRKPASSTCSTHVS